MKIIYQLTLEYEMNEDDLLGDTPREFLKSSLEDDPALLIDNSTILKSEFKKVVREEMSVDEDDEDDDGLTELDEEELDID